MDILLKIKEPFVHITHVIQLKIGTYVTSALDAKKINLDGKVT